MSTRFLQTRVSFFSHFRAYNVRYSPQTLTPSQIEQLVYLARLMAHEARYAGLWY